MQPAQEVQWFPMTQDEIDRFENMRQEDLLFVHHPTSLASIYCPKDNSLYGNNDMVDSIYLTEGIPFQNLPWHCNGTGTVTEVKNFILSNPYMKGILIDLNTAVQWKFRCVKSHTSKELFEIRFDRSKAKTAFKEWLWDKVHERYIDMDYDDPKKDPLDGYRETIWHDALPLFRTYNQRVTPINKLPSGIDPAMLPMIALDTVKRSIQEIMTLG